MRTSSIFLLTGVSLLGLAAASGLVLACSASGDDGQSAGADLVSAEAGAPETPAQIGQKKLVGAWLPSGESTLRALVMLPGGTRLRVNRDLTHTPANDLDKQEVDRTGLSAEVLSFDGTSTGKLELTVGLFVNGKSLKRIEDYDFVVKDDTLTLTETSERVVQNVFVKDAGPPPEVDAGAITLRPATTLTRAASWCAKPRASSDPAQDCNSQLESGVFKPADMPATCAGNEDLCIRCEEHKCQVHEVSSCELSRNICVSSVEECEFDNGRPVGQVATIDTEGHPIDCNKSPAGKGVCCQDFSGSRR